MQESIKNLLIYFKDNGMAEYVYLSFHLLSFIVAVPCFLWLGKKMDIGAKKSFSALLLTCIMFLILMYFIGWLEAYNGLGNFGRKNVVTVYIWIPLMCIASAKIVRMDYRILLNMMAFAMPLIQAVSRPGCLAVGCCRGFEWEHGIYQPWIKQYLFPMPAFEMLWMFGIAFFMLWFIKKNKYKPSDWTYPLMMLIYGTVQFFSEFYIDNDKIWNNWSLRSFHEVSIVAVAVVWLYVLYERYLKEVERKNRFKKPKSRKED